MLIIHLQGSGMAAKHNFLGSSDCSAKDLMALTASKLNGWTDLNSYLGMLNKRRHYITKQIELCSVSAESDLSCLRIMQHKGEEV